MAGELRALEALRLHWAPVPEDVWTTAPFHVEGVHGSAERTIRQGLADAVASRGTNPLGVALVGQKGAGKTHLLSWVREQAEFEKGYFVLINLADPAHFWPSAATSLRESLAWRAGDRPSQLRLFLERLLIRSNAPERLHAPIIGQEAVTPADLDRFVAVARTVDNATVRDCQDTLRALVIYESGDPAAQDVAQTYFLSRDEQDAGERTPWRIRPGVQQPQQLIRDVSRLLALTGPTVIAVDQLDPLLAQADLLDRMDGTPEKWQHLLDLDHVATGLMTLRELARRTLMIIACLPNTWETIQRKSVTTVQDRFRPASPLQAIPDETVGRLLVEKRFAHFYAKVGFVPPYPTWPIRPEAFRDVRTYSPRELLKQVDAHVRACLDRGVVTELTSLDREAGPVETPERRLPPEADLGELDARFEHLKDVVDISGALDPKREDDEMPTLLAAALHAWIVERAEPEGRYSFDPNGKGKPRLHGRLRATLDEATDAEAHWSFRAISGNNPIAVLNRIREARLAAGHRGGLPNRRLFLLRREDWLETPKNRQAIDAFHAEGGVTQRPDEDDLRTFAALDRLIKGDSDNLHTWLRTRQPASRSALLRAALGDLGSAPGAPAGDGSDDVPGDLGSGVPGVPPAPPPGRHRAEPAQSRPQVPIGVLADGGEPVHLDVEALRTHTAIFAGSGSGKTVLIRRLVEECALQGVSAIVLDLNNDLARLGEPWPEPPAAWTPGDGERAAEYLAGTDVVIWTPRREAGRPVSFQPLPDFGAVLGDGDEMAVAVDAAVTALAPRARVDGNTLKAIHGRAVLTESLWSFARHGWTGLDRFVDYLAALPEGVSRLERGTKLANEMAQTLTAAMVNDPLFGGAGTAVDPGLLLTPAPGRRARVSVVSFVGLPAEEQRQSFVNQLQMALFAWVKRHPAGDRPLGGLLVMDEAQTLAPSGAMTACTASTLALASQARKYGLGLVFATQAPKALHNRIPGNAATQFFGLLNAPVQIAAAREMAQAKGGDLTDLARLTTGEFYAATPGRQFVKLRTPLCLTHHPRSPLTVEEVIRRAAPTNGR